MSDSLREQLLKAGLGRSSTGRHPKKKGSKVRSRSGASGKSEGGIDLAHAYRMRASAEARERAAAAAAAEAAAREKRERRRRLRQALAGQVLNKADAGLVRHFEYGGKIRRIYVDAAQLAALNRGELGVVQMGGGYKLVSAGVIEAIRAFASEHIALLIVPTSDATADDGVPDDLMW